jgi:hypothetical protein
MIFQCPQNEEMWGYWENHLDLIPKKKHTTTEEDHKHRLKNAKN